MSRFLYFLLLFSDTLNYDVSRTTESVFIKQLAFSTCLIRILGDGLQTYNMTRYRQLNKRIGGTIRYYYYNYKFCQEQGCFFSQFFNWLQLFLSDKHIPDVAGHCQNRYKNNDPLKMVVGCFSYIFINFQSFYFLTRIIPGSILKANNFRDTVWLQMLFLFWGFQMKGEIALVVIRNSHKLYIPFTQIHC